MRPQAGCNAIALPAGESGPSILISSTQRQEEKVLERVVRSEMSVHI